MTKWRTFIDPSIGDGQNTINGIIADGSTFGVGISDDLSVTGLSTFADNVNVNSDIYVQGDLRLGGKLKDGDNAFGTSGQVLSSDGTDTRWVNAGSLSAGAASLVAINDDSNTNANRFITFVDSSSGNNSLKTDSAIKYNPSTNILNLNATASGIKFGPGDSITDDAHIEWLGGNNAGHLRISTSDDNGTEYIQFGDYDGGGRSGTFTQWLRISRNTGTFTGTFSATTFSGSGASLTSLNASNISSGTINAARVPTLNQNTTGSAATLTTARTIGGVSFNGSANINLPGVNQTGNQNTSGNAATATVLETTRNFSISGEITANAQSFNGSGNVALSATVDDNVIDEANLKISNSPTNGRFLQCNTGVSGGLTWAEVTLPSSSTLSGTTLASGITASSITSLGTLTGLTVNGNASITGGNASITGVLTLNPNDDRVLILDRNIASPSNYYNDLQMEVRATSGTAGIGLHRNGHSHVGMYTNASNVLKFDYNGGTVTLNHNTGTVWGSGNDGSGSGLDSDKLDGQEGSYYRNAGNLNAGTIPDARLANSSLFVTGMIMMYTGSTAPSGWAICNGQNGTPDLRDRFIVGAGSAYSVNNTGGSKDATLVSHSHTINNHVHGFSANTGNQSANHNHSFSGSGSSSHSHGFTGVGGNDHNQNVRHTTVMRNRSNPTVYTAAGNTGVQSANVSISISGNTGNNSGNHHHFVSGNTGDPSDRGTNTQGSSATNANLPPYYALMFIMKL